MPPTWRGCEITPTAACVRLVYDPVCVRLVYYLAILRAIRLVYYPACVRLVYSHSPTILHANRYLVLVLVLVVLAI